MCRRFGRLLLCELVVAEGEGEGEGDCDCDCEKDTRVLRCGCDCNAESRDMGECETDLADGSGEGEASGECEPVGEAGAAAGTTVPSFFELRAHASSLVDVDCTLDGTTSEMGRHAKSRGGNLKAGPKLKVTEAPM